MSYYLRVICKSDSSPPARQLIDFINEGVYFDDPPTIERFGGVDQSNLDAWDKLVIHYDQGKRPVILENTGPSSLLDQEIQELRMALHNFAIDEPIQRVGDHLDGTRRIIALEIDRVGATNDAWAMIDCLQSFIAGNYQGIVYAPDDGYYDPSLQPLIKFDQLRQV